MPDPLPRLPVLAQAYDAAYVACAREVSRLAATTSPKPSWSACWPAPLPIRSP